jgi:CBS domain-containing protein
MGIEDTFREIAVTALDSDPPVVLDSTTPVRKVIQQMQDQQISCALLTRGDKLAGIFTERDVLLKVLGTAGALDRPVAEYMTTDPVHLREDAPIRKAILHMQRGGFRNVPVVDANGRIVTCVRQRDIVRFLVTFFAPHVLNLPPDPGQVARTREGG